MKKLAVMASAAVMAATPALAADIVIGVPNWPSVAVTANVLKVVIEDNFGLDVELQNATNPIVFEAMDKGSMDIHPEVWMPNQQNLHRPACVVSFCGLFVGPSPPCRAMLGCASPRPVFRRHRRRYLRSDRTLRRSAGAVGARRHGRP